LRGVSRYWMNHTDEVHDQPTLQVFVTSSLHEGGYHDYVFQQWVVEELARHESVSYRRAAWVFLGQTQWHIEESRLLEAVEFERQELAAQRHTVTSVEMMHHSMAKIARRLYPDSDWWPPLIQSRYGF